jgi:4-hydroxy-3-methylbut-2-enyl diphosphate reductase
VVLKLQKRIRKSFLEQKNDGQIVIFGKEGHAEVNGLVGQTDGKAIVVSRLADLDKINFTKPISIFSQTTMSIDEFNLIGDEIRKRMISAQGASEVSFSVNDTICRQVSNRAPRLRQFAKQYDAIIFVSGRESSNGKYLFEVCKSVNPKTYFATSQTDIDPDWLQGIQSVGICGATSTPRWLMEEVSKFVKSYENK